MELLNRFFGMVQLKKKPYREASKEGFSTAAANFLIAAVASALGVFFLTWDVVELIGSIIFGWIGLFVVFAIGVLIVWGFSKLFGGKAKYGEHYTSASYLALWSVPSIIPIVGPFISMLGGLWSIVMHIVLVQGIHKLDVGRAAAAVLLPYLILFAIGAILVLLVGVAFVGMMSGAMPGMMT